ncbi:MAG: hypothetical protein KDI83_10890 [Gammaproteobacteria bacterium]|nr:hypothetical protein [Gammaproteobacteria bacterium]
MITDLPSGFVQGPSIDLRSGRRRLFAAYRVLTQAVQDVIPHDELVRLGQEYGRIV